MLFEDVFDDPKMSRYELRKHFEEISSVLNARVEELNAKMQPILDDASDSNAISYSASHHLNDPNYVPLNPYKSGVPVVNIHYPNFDKLMRVAKQYYKARKRQDELSAKVSNHVSRRLI